MAVTPYVYQPFLAQLVTGYNMVQSSNLYVGLLTNAYEPDLKMDEYFGGIYSFEVPDSGTYEQGGSPIPIDGLQYDRPNNCVRVLASTTITWTIANQARWAVVYDYMMGFLVGVLDLGGPQTGQIQVSFPNGLIILQ